MHSGYHHVEMTEDTRPKTAFTLPANLVKWEFLRCPFGLAQAPAYFQRLINDVLDPFDFAFGYLDDILIYSPEFEWTEICQKSFDLLKAMVSEEPILVYPDPSKSYVLFTDASKYAWSCVLTQTYTHEIGGKTVKILHAISYQSGLFKGSQLNWACLTKEAYAIYMSIKKLDYYLVDADITL